MKNDVPHNKTHGFVDGTESTHRILLSISQWASGSVKFCAYELTRLYGIPEGSPMQQGTPAFIMGVADRIEHAADVLLNRLRDEPPPVTFTEHDIKNVLTALYQDGHVDLVLADRVAALMQSPSPMHPRHPYDVEGSEYLPETCSHEREHRSLICRECALIGIRRLTAPPLLAAPEGRVRALIGKWRIQAEWLEKTFLRPQAHHLCREHADELEAALAPLAEPPASGIYPRGHGPKP